MQSMLFANMSPRLRKVGSAQLTVTRIYLFLVLLLLICYQTLGHPIPRTKGLINCKSLSVNQNEKQGKTFII